MIDDLGHLSDRYEYMKVLGRPRQWRKTFTAFYNYYDIQQIPLQDFLQANRLHSREEERKGELYVRKEDLKIVFTCHNKILAENLRDRIPEFFDFMKVDEQIKWQERLWVMSSWGSKGDKNSGVYSYVCNYYNLHFERFSYSITFDEICRKALKELNELENFEPCFDYILIDESQDFTDGFFELCRKVTRYCLYIAGDIFQNVFEKETISEVNPDFLLNKCYRTDPKTLMCAHAIGMGLFEKNII